MTIRIHQNCRCLEQTRFLIPSLKDHNQIILDCQKSTWYSQSWLYKLKLQLFMYFGKRELQGLTKESQSPSDFVKKAP